VFGSVSVGLACVQNVSFIGRFCAQVRVQYPLILLWMGVGRSLRLTPDLSGDTLMSKPTRQYYIKKRRVGVSGSDVLACIEELPRETQAILLMMMDAYRSSIKNRNRTVQVGEKAQAEILGCLARDVEVLMPLFRRLGWRDE